MTPGTSPRGCRFPFSVILSDASSRRGYAKRFCAGDVMQRRRRDEAYPRNCATGFIHVAVVNRFSQLLQSEQQG